ncbi:MAG: MerR family DNA-binding transcriptional regulator [Maritimibacter sp.]|uniref:MerR family transcriptional regulator n=1 Tax=Amaricoccus macauensis TaxID=57001 RepID=UPI001DFA8F53|nr:MerR family DNA-binding transcriptional regulator [Maritimibacter sp.]MCB2111329.1 MerR family DNA-binding transcriptional regulator [Paracoccaceae bacterium]
MSSVFSISDLARELGVTPRTIRYYEEQGLILPERAGSQRIYSMRDRARLILILRGKRLGFSLQDIGEYLALYDADPAHQTQVLTLVGKVRARIADLEDQLETVRITLAELREIETMAVAALGCDVSDPDGA